MCSTRYDDEQQKAAELQKNAYMVHNDHHPWEELVVSDEEKAEAESQIRQEIPPLGRREHNPSFGR